MTLSSMIIKYGLLSNNRTLWKGWICINILDIWYTEVVGSDTSKSPAFTIVAYWSKITKVLASVVEYKYKLAENVNT